jgi:hypothetical protein
MALGGKMHHNLGLETRQNFRDARAIANVAAREGITKVAGDRLERIEIGRKGQFVEHANVIVAVHDKTSRHCGPDKASASCYQHAHT